MYIYGLPSASNSNQRDLLVLGRGGGLNMLVSPYLRVDGVSLFLIHGNMACLAYL